MATLSDAFISLNDIINNFLISYTGPGKLIPDAKRTEVMFHARRCLQEFAYETLKSRMGVSGEFVKNTTGTLTSTSIPTDNVVFTSLLRTPLLQEPGYVKTVSRILDDVPDGLGTGKYTAYDDEGYAYNVTIFQDDPSTEEYTYLFEVTFAPYGYPFERAVGSFTTLYVGTQEVELTQVRIVALTTGTEIPSVPMSATTSNPPPSFNTYYIDKASNSIITLLGLQRYGYTLNYLSNGLTVDELAAIPKLAEEALYTCMVYAILANREGTDGNLLQRLLIEKIDRLERSKSRLIFTNFS